MWSSDMSLLIQVARRGVAWPLVVQSYHNFIDDSDVE